VAGRVRRQGPDRRGRAQAASARQEGRSLIVAVTSAPPPELLAAAADAYLDVFSQPPYGETEPDREAFVDRVRRYAERDGFRLVLATDGDTVTGFALAVIAHSGDWYRDRVAEQLEPAEIAEWLGESCLELVHLGVRPAYARRGIGRRVHDATLADCAAPTAILTVDPAAEAARHLYARQGWLVLRESVTVGAGSGAILMARRLG
jgi:ribosomal protein S18 acetylase RimI-like enzyme